MKAAVLHSYGPPDVLQIEEVPTPIIGKNEILVKVKATAVTSADSRIRGARFPKGFGFLARLAFGITMPRVKILGSTYSGVVHQVGSDITDYKVGDEVCGMTGIGMGAYAEFIKVSKLKSITIKPKNISHEEAAGVLFGGTAALYFIREKIRVQKGETALINGASGAVGTSAVQLARYFGAKVTGITSGDNAKLVKSIGAESIIDYKEQSLNDCNQNFDVVLDTIGNISPRLAKKLLKNNGRAGLMVASLGEMVKARGQIKVGTATEKKEDIEFLLNLVENSELTVVIDRVYTLDDIVEAHKHVDSGQKVGNVIVRVDETSGHGV